MNLLSKKITPQQSALLVELNSQPYRILGWRVGYKKNTVGYFGLKTDRRRCFFMFYRCKDNKKILSTNKN